METIFTVWTTMPDIVVLHWQPGGAGDLVQSLLLSQPRKNQGIVSEFTTELTGRVKPQISDIFNRSFVPNSQGWYTRSWSADDCILLQDLIKDLDCEFFVIPTHLLDQVDFLKSHFSNCKTAGITYPPNMFPLVLKNFCKKVALNDEPTLREIYNNSYHHYLRSKNIFSEFVMLEQLRHGTTIKPNFDEIFDINISLENLYSGSLVDLTALINDTEFTRNILQVWLSNQNVLQKHRYNISSSLEHVLGFNSKVLHRLNADNVLLDSFDNILIKHHFKQKLNNIPSFKTLKQADQFIHKNMPM